MISYTNLYMYFNSTLSHVNYNFASCLNPTITEMEFKHNSKFDCE